MPHLSAQTQRELLASTPPYLRDARSKGTPSLGSGAIYPVPESDIVCAPFAIPPYWRRGFGLDVGWNRTAAVWIAEDPTDRSMYAYAEHYQGQAVPAIHALSIKARGEWIKGAIDPASRGRSQSDGEQLMATYQSLGLKLVPAVNAVDAGIHEVWSRLSFGRLKVFSTMQNWLAEYRLYRRDENGKIVKKADHLMDCTRYCIQTFNAISSVQLIDHGRSSATGPADARAGY